MHSPALNKREFHTFWHFVYRCLSINIHIYIYIRKFFCIRVAKPKKVANFDSNIALNQNGPARAQHSFQIAQQKPETDPKFNLIYIYLYIFIYIYIYFYILYIYIWDKWRRQDMETYNFDGVRLEFSGWLAVPQIATKAAKRNPPPGRVGRFFLAPLRNLTCWNLELMLIGAWTQSWSIPEQLTFQHRYEGMLHGNRLWGSR